MFDFIYLLEEQFQSTHPLRGATGKLARREFSRLISIHAPLAGCDSFCGISNLIVINFNPRTPCGVRLMRPYMSLGIPAFQSTHPLRGATGETTCMSRSWTDFNPRTPCGVRRDFMFPSLSVIEFQSTHPLRGATSKTLQRSSNQRISIHAPLAGCDFSGFLLRSVQSNFNPRTPCGVRLVVQPLCG